MSFRIRKEPRTLVGIHRRLEVWRPINKLTPAQMKDAKAFKIFGDVEKALIDFDERELDFKDLVVNAALNDLCAKVFGTPTNVFDYVAIGEDDTAPAAGNTALGSEYMRVQGTYSKDAGVGECSMDATFNIDATKSLNECGLFNAAAAGTMYCRDTYTTKSVIDGDTVKVYYTPKFQVPA